MNYALGYYGNNGKIMETVVFIDINDFDKEIKESNEIGRPIKIIKDGEIQSINESICEEDKKKIVDFVERSYAKIEKIKEENKEHLFYKSEKETMSSCAKRLEKLKESEYELER